MDPLQNLYAALRAYSGVHISTANISTRTASDSDVGVTYISVKELLDKIGVPLVDPLSQEDWLVLVQSINAPFVGNNERAGVHPRLKQILRAVSHGTQFRWTYEQEHVDSNAVVTIPDFPLYWNDDRISHLEAKRVGKDKLRHSLQQSEGYLASQMLNQIELAGGLNNSVVSGLCLGSTGIRLALSRVTADGMTGNLIVERTMDSGLQLWTERGHPISETPGIRVLRSLLAASPTAWLKADPAQCFSLAGGNVATTHAVLGRGAFCVAFRCTNPSTGDNFVLKRRLVTSVPVGERKHTDPLEQLRREQAALDAFGRDAAARQLLPVLYAHAPPVSAQSPFLASVPVGVPLMHLRNTLSTASRRQQVPQLLSDLFAALAAAHSLQFCHTDVRPGNVVRADGRFVLIDWGLTRRPFEPMHAYSANYHYIAARVLLVRDASPPIAYDPLFDKEAAKYVALAFDDGAPRLIPEAWTGISMRSLIEVRRSMLTKLALAQVAPETHEYEGLDLGVENELERMEIAADDRGDVAGEDGGEADDGSEDGENMQGEGEEMADTVLVPAWRVA